MNLNQPQHPYELDEDLSYTADQLYGGDMCDNPYMGGCYETPSMEENPYMNPLSPSSLVDELNRRDLALAKSVVKNTDPIVEFQETATDRLGQTAESDSLNEELLLNKINAVVDLKSIGGEDVPQEMIQVALWATEGLDNRGLERTIREVLATEMTAEEVLRREGIEGEVNTDWVNRYNKQVSADIHLAQVISSFAKDASIKDFFEVMYFQHRGIDAHNVAGKVTDPYAAMNDLLTSVLTIEDVEERDIALTTLFKNIEEESNGKFSALEMLEIAKSGKEPNLILDDIFLALDSASAVPLLGWALGAVVAPMKAMSAIGKAYKLNKVMKAQRLIDAGIADKTGEVAKNLGLARDDLLSQYTVFDTSILSGKGLTREKIEDLQLYQMFLGKITADINDTNRVTTLANVSEDMIEQSAKEYIEKNRGIVPSNISVENTGKFLKYKATYKDASGKTDTMEFRLTRDDINGELGVEPIGAVAKLFADPYYLFKSAGNKLVGAATRNLQAADRATGYYGTALKEINSTLPLLDRKKFRNALEKGDIDEKVWSVAELRQNFGLSDKGIDAYYKYRSLMDMAWFSNARRLAEKYEFEGLKKASILGADELGKVFDSFESANGLMREGGKAYDAEKGTYITKDKLEDLYAKENKVLIQTKDYIPTGDGSFTNTFIVPKDSVSDIGMFGGLSFRRGYVPKINKDTFYFIKHNKTGKTVDFRGTSLSSKIVSSDVVEAFSSKSGAEARKAELIKSGKYKESDLTIAFDRDMPVGEADDLIRNMNYGKYVGARKQTPLKLDGDENIARVDPMQAASDYLNMLARHNASDEWASVMKEEWVNQVKNTPGALWDEMARFEQARDPWTGKLKIEGIKEGTPEYRALDTAHQYIQDQLGIPTAADRARTASINSFAETLDAWGAKTPARWILRFDHTNPARLAKTMAFHPMLGMMNPAQIVMQASGFLVASSLHPTSAIKALNRVWDLAAMDRAVGNKAVLDLVGNKDEAMHIWSLWNKSGFHHSVKSQGDLQAAVDGSSLAKGIMNKTLEKGLIPFKVGENFNRRMSFLIAHDQMVKSLGRRVTDKELPALIDRTNTIMMNMSTANKSFMQEGYKGIFTQFMQVHQKYVGTLLNKSNLTGAERIRLASVQSLLFGLGGFPFARFVAKQFSGDVEQGTFDDETLQFFHEGVTGMLASGAGLKNDFASRMSLGEAFFEGWLRILSADIDGFSDFFRKGAFGPAGVVGERGWNAISTFKTAMMGEPDVTKWDDVTWKYVASVFAEIPTSTKNYFAGKMLLESGKMYSTSMRGHSAPLYDEAQHGQINEVSARFVQMGFALKDIPLAFEQKKYADSVNKRVTDIATAMAHMFNKEFTTDKESSAAQIFNNVQFATVFKAMLANESPEFKDAVIQSFKRKVTITKDFKSQMADEFEKALLLDNRSGLTRGVEK